MPILYTSSRVLCSLHNLEHPTYLYRARLGFRKRNASKPSLFLSLLNFPREKLPFSIPSMYMRIYALIQLNDTILYHNGRGKFRPHITLGLLEILLGFWSNIGPPFLMHTQSFTYHIRNGWYSSILPHKNHHPLHNDWTILISNISRLLYTVYSNQWLTSE